MGIAVQSFSGSNKYVEDKNTSAQNELTFVRGRTYHIYQIDTSNNVHPLHFSTTVNGTTGGGVVYSDGMTWQMGNPSSTGDYTSVTTTQSDWTSNHATYNGEDRIIE